MTIGIAFQHADPRPGTIRESEKPHAVSTHWPDDRPRPSLFALAIR